MSSIKFLDSHFISPILVASGTYGYGNETQDFVDINKIGGIVTKSVTRYPREGNPPPRIVETNSGMLNSIGLANLGVEAYCKNKLPFLNNLILPSIPSQYNVPSCPITLQNLVLSCLVKSIFKLATISFFFFVFPNPRLI